MNFSRQFLWHNTINNRIIEKFNTKSVKFWGSKRAYCNHPRSSDESGSSIPSLYNIKRILKTSGYKIEDGFTCIKTTCPACDRSDDNTIYINKITGDTICPKCQHLSNWNTISKFLSVPITKNIQLDKDLLKYQKLYLESKKPPIDHEQLTRSNSQIVKLKSLNKNQILDMVERFKLNNIPNIETILFNLDLSYDSSLHKLYFPLIDIRNKTIGYKILTINEDDNETITENTFPESNTPGLVVFQNSNKTSVSSKAILVLNILDFLALISQKVNATVICLPYHLKTLPQECLPSLEQYQKLVLWFNYNTAGWDTARIFSKKLDEKRCYFVRPTDNNLTPYKALLKNYDLKAIFSKAEPILHKAITTFSSLRQDVLSDLQNFDKVQGVKWKRYPVLNKLLKGHRKGELTILTGPTGCGKTTFMSEYSLDLAMQGVNTLWGSFEIRNTRLASTLLRQFVGFPLDDKLSEFDYWADKFEQLPMYFMRFHGQQPIKIVMEAIEHAQYVHDVHHVIIDNVQFMMGLFDDSKHVDRFWKQDVIIAAFRSFATKKNCHVTLVIHPRKEKEVDDLTTSSIFGGAKASQEADNVLIIQDKRLTSIRGKKYLQIAKNRYSGDLGIMPLDFDKQSLSYASKKIKQEESAQQSTNISKCDKSELIFEKLLKEINP